MKRLGLRMRYTTSHCQCRALSESSLMQLNHSQRKSVSLACNQSTACQLFAPSEADTATTTAEEDDEDNMEEIDIDNIINDGRRTRGKSIDFAKAAENAGDELDEDDDEDDDDFEEEKEDDHEMKD